MAYIRSANATLVEAGAALPLPWVECTVRAGFPSPAVDFATKRHDLNELLITHPAATFFWEVRGTSMLGAGISDGDILVVNRALQPLHRDIVVAEVDGDFTVKYALIKAGVMLVELQPDTVMQAELDFGADDMPIGRAKLAGAVDALNDRFGRGTVVLASESLSSTPRAWEMKQQRRTRTTPRGGKICRLRGRKRGAEALGSAYPPAKIS